MVRQKKRSFFGSWDEDKTRDYFVALRNRLNLPPRSEKKPLKVSDIPRGAFISHSYSDQSNLQTLLAALPSDFKPVIWPRIDVSPTEFVSTPLLESLSAAPALIYLIDERSGSSRWVAFERDTVLRMRKPVFSFNPLTSEFNQDKSRPKFLGIHALYTSADTPTALELIDWMEVNRSFRVEKFSPMDYNDMGEYAADIMDYSGIFLAFTGKNTIRDLDMNFVRLACEQDEGECVQKRLAIACLDPPDAWIPEDIERYVIPGHKFDLTKDGKIRPWSANCVDDLIVGLVWGR